MALKLTLKRQYDYAKSQGWLPYFADAAAKHGHTTADLMGVASRESNMKNIKGDFRGGYYHGFSLMQLDIHSHRAWIESGAWQDVEQAIMKGAAALAEKRDLIVRTSQNKIARVRFNSGKSANFTPRPLSNAQLRHCTLAAYNCGGAAYYHFSQGNDIDRGTTGKDYGRDVIARAAIFQQLLNADHVAPSKQDTPKPVDDPFFKNVQKIDKTSAPVEQSQSEPSNGDTVQVSQNVTVNNETEDSLKNALKSESAKRIGLKAVGKISAVVTSAWGAGTHGKILLILIVAAIVGIGGYEIYKHRARLKEFLSKVVKRFNG